MSAPEPIHAHAAENLRFIRDAMARASAFTAVPGWGGMAMGVSAVATAAISGSPDGSLRWMTIWFADAALAASIALTAMSIKARRSGTPLSSAAPAQRFALAFVPPLAAGMVLTPVFATLGLATRLLAIVPAIIVIVLYGYRGTTPLIILSQVVLSLQLSFAVFPLVIFTGDPGKMGRFASPWWLKALAWPVAVMIALLNAWLLWQTFAGV